MYRIDSKNDFAILKPGFLAWPLLAACALLVPMSAKAKIEPQISHQQQDYQLCAQQRVTKALFFNVVDVGVYYQDCNNATDIFDQHPKLLRFSYLRKVKGKQFTEGADDFLSKNLTADEKQTCLTDFTEFNAIYKDVADGDYYDLFVTPGHGLNLRLNESELADLDKPDCAAPYLNIWFGQESMDDDFSELQTRLKSLN